MPQITRDDYDIVQDLSEQLIDHTETFPDDHPLVKILVAMQEPLHEFETTLKKSDTYYSEPYFRALDDPRTSLTACPTCGNTSDYCQYCGSPRIFKSSLTEDYLRCEDCGAYEPAYYQDELPRLPTTMSRTRSTRNVSPKPSRRTSKTQSTQAKSNSSTPSSSHKIARYTHNNKRNKRRTQGKILAWTRIIIPKSHA